MQNITEMLLNYREATRHLWNTYFRGKVVSLRDSPILDSYEEIDRLLFSSLVLINLQKDINTLEYRTRPISYLIIRPREGAQHLGFRIGEKRGNSTTMWNVATSVEFRQGTELEFIGLFEWDSYGFVSYSYVKVHISRCPAKPDIEGKDALIEISEAQFFFV